MLTLSPLLTLPLHAIQIVVDHVVGSSRVRYDGVRPNSNEELVIELLAKYIYSGEALRCLSQAPYDGCAFPLVHKITFIVFVDTTYTDYEAHDSAWVSRVNELFNLGEDNATGLADIEDQTTDPLEIEANVSSFVPRVKEMAPELGEIEV
ncbi:hypothetical protein GGI08_004724 [Coemansia sp. S2]|nr:hypothetical protein GGI08_004724 [Coemansia sp. S2]